MAGVSILSAAILVLVLSAASALGAQGIDPRRVSVLYTGDHYPGITPYPAMKQDAMIVVTPVQASYIHYAGISAEDIKKSMRVYMARTYAEYVDKYDVMILSDAEMRVFTLGQVLWFADGVRDHGIGLLMVGGWESFGGSWTASPVEEVLPVSFPQNIWVSGYIKIEILPEAFENEFIKTLPYDPLPEYMRVGTDGNMVELKRGAELLAKWKVHTLQYEDPPCYVTWEVEKGRTYAMCHDWTPGGGLVMSRWDYYRDYAINLMLYLAGRDLPEDPFTVHRYRETISNVALGKNLLLSLMEFVESLGGSSIPIATEVGSMDEIVSQAQMHYLDKDYTVALALSEDAFGRLKEIEELAVKVKNDALFWVYTIEWLVVTGVALVSGVVLWFIMVRRSLYREVGVTRSL